MTHCDATRSTPAPAASASARAAASTAPTARRPTQQPLPNEVVEIPGGAFLAGSVPGEPGRVPELEPRSHDVELGPFRIDRLPFPNDPAKPPLTNVTRDEAKKHCASRGARLCTELEWERACKGPESDRYTTGEDWHDVCAKEPYNCASGFDVLGMGAALREWVASDIAPKGKGKGKERLAVVRGALRDEPASFHRCATRRGIDAEDKASDTGFRCCRGAPNAAVVPEPALGTTFEKVSLTAARLEKLFQQHPKTQMLAKDVKFFREPDAANTVVARGPGDKMGFSFTVSPLKWNPSPGAQYLVVSGRSGERTSFVVAFYVLGKDAYELAASYVMQDEPGPVAFAYSQYIRPRFHFSTCWGCPGETGKILYREPDAVNVFQP